MKQQSPISLDDLAIVVLTEKVAKSADQVEVVENVQPFSALIVTKERVHLQVRISVSSAKALAFAISLIVLMSSHLSAETITLVQKLLSGN
jgi:hypothetical protein